MTTTERPVPVITYTIDPERRRVTFHGWFGVASRGALYPDSCDYALTFADVASRCRAHAECPAHLRGARDDAVQVAADDLIDRGLIEE